MQGQLNFETKFKYINVNVDGNCEFSINKLIVDYFSGMQERVLIYDVVSGKSMELIPFDIISEDGTYYTYLFQESKSHTVPEWTAKLLKRFHWTWYEQLQDFLDSETFQTMNKKLNNSARKNYQIHPAQADVYNAFSTNFHNTKVVIIGQSPYANEKHANGWAFSSKNGEKTASLLEFDKALKTKLDYSLQSWIDQGILLINSSFTVGPNSNIEYHDEWKPFFVEVLKSLRKQDYILFILMGNYAQKAIAYINPNHDYISVEHPAAAARDSRDWSHQNVFEIANQTLVKHRKQPIRWA